MLEVAWRGGGGMSELSKLRAEAEEVTDKTSSGQSWFTLHLKAASSELPPNHEKSEAGQWGQRRKVPGGTDRCLESGWQGLSDTVHWGYDLKMKL